MLIESDIYSDDRGFFMESYRESDLPVRFVQDNFSLSHCHVLRGLHYQTGPSAQDKLVRCINGVIFDVIVDLRKESPCYGAWDSYKLMSFQSLYVPKGIAHGFLTMSNRCIVLYKVSEYYDPTCEKTLIWNDPDIGIEWPLNGYDPILSEKDKKGKTLKELENETPNFR